MALKNGLSVFPIRISFHVLVIIAVVLFPLVLAINPFEKGPQLYHPRGGSGQVEDDFIFIRGKFFQREQAPTSDLNNKSTSSLWYSQCVDHSKYNDSNQLCTERWNQRYWLKTMYYRNDGPIFFMFGGEGSAEGFIDAGKWLRYAVEYGAVVVCLEHRFYGQSFPTFDMTYQSMTLLTSHQALADAVSFILWLKSYLNLKDAKVVTFGGSYPGNLAAWLRLLYPGIVNVAVASSAPLEARFEFPEYFRTISEVIYELNPVCYWKIFGTFRCMERLVHEQGCDESFAKSNYTDQTDLPPALHQCYSYNLNVEAQKQLFFHVLSARWASNFPGHSNAEKCITLGLQEGEDVIDNYANYLVSSGQAPETCLKTKRHLQINMTDEVLDFIKSLEGSARNGKSWTWQTCYEFGYYQVSDPYHKLFGNEWDTTVDVRRCQKAFPDANFTKESIQSGIRNTNAFYKGKEYDGTCTIFVNGQWDPWHSLGLNKQIETSDRNTVISIPRAEHCEDMQDRPNMSADMIAAQAIIQDQIGKYLRDPRC